MCRFFKIILQFNDFLLCFQQKFIASALKDKKTIDNGYST